MPSPSETRTDAGAAETADPTHRRFDRAARLFSEPGLGRPRGAHVVVFGMGGVGSFSAEAISRSAVGRLTLVDFVTVCITNVNRQLHALKGNVGRRKVGRDGRAAAPHHPTGEVAPVARFYNEESSDELLSAQIDFMLDANELRSQRGASFRRGPAPYLCVGLRRNEAASLTPT